MIPDEIRNLHDNPCNEKRIWRDCSYCGGTGEEPDINWYEECSECYGTGKEELSDEEIQDLKDNEAEAKFERERERINEFERHNATDCFGNCFSDADPGL
jgi:hypothetical protein